MKNLLKVFVLIAVLFAAVTETADAQTRRGRVATTIGGSTNTTSGSAFNEKLSGGSALTPADVIDYYIDFEDEYKDNCVRMNVATNEVSKLDHPVYSQFPTSTWMEGVLFSKDDESGFESIKFDRYWSNTFHNSNYGGGGQPFHKLKKDKVGIELNKVGNGVEGFLIKEQGSKLPIKIFGVMTKTHGHILYGSYGNHGGFITISLFKWNCYIVP